MKSKYKGFNDDKNNMLEEKKISGKIRNPKKKRKEENGKACFKCNESNFLIL